MNPVLIRVGQGKDSRDIAVRQRQGNSPGLVWLGGYRSDMLGTKAEALDNWAADRGRACCRHDYSGHGESSGEFVDGTISRWLLESLTVFDRFTRGPQILVGSSMGAWVALRMVEVLVARRDKMRLQGLLLLAPAPDFTHELMKPQLSDEHKDQLRTQGYLEEISQYSDEPNIYTNQLFEDGDNNRVMTGLIETQCPVHIIQGMKDEDVPYDHAMKLMTFLPDENVTLTLVKDGDHRLSRESDIELMLAAIDGFDDSIGPIN
jgi:pimeloyl-ACP methyl ester carboxylesterase